MSHHSKEKRECLESISSSEYVCYDFETTSLSPRTGEIDGVAISTDDGDWWFPEDSGKDVLHTCAMREDLCLIAHNQAFDYKWLKYKWEIEPKCQLADTMIAMWLLDENYKRYSLDHAVKRFFDHDMISYEQVTALHGTLFEGSTDSPSLGEYAKEDSRYCLKLFHALFKPLKEQGLLKVFFELEMPVCKFIADMEYNGIKISAKNLGDFRLNARKELEDTADEIYELCGKKFLLTSPQQVSEILFDSKKKGGLGLPTKDITEKGKSGYYSTSKEVLERLVDKVSNKVPKLLLKHRELSKAIDSFSEPFVQLLRESTDQRVHPSFHQIGTVTGRLSASGPNLQQMPAKGGFRDVFVPEEGNIFIGADFSQVELRVLAHLSEEPRMLEAFRNGDDIHDKTRELMGLPSGTQGRKIAKCVVGDTLFFSKNGVRRIDEFKEDFTHADQFISASDCIWNGNEYVSMTNVYYNGKAKIHNIITRRGVLRAAENHQILTSSGDLKRSEDVVEGDILSLADIPTYDYSPSLSVNPFAICSRSDYSNDTKLFRVNLDSKFAYFAGIFVGDGYFCGKRHVSVAVGKDYPDWRAEIIRSIEEVGFNYNRVVSSSENCDSIYFGSAVVCRFLRMLGIADESGKKLRIPKWVFANKNNMWNFLAGLIDTDGTVSKDTTASITTKSLDLASDLCILLRSLVGDAYSMEPCWNSKYEKYYWRVHILRAGMDKLLDTNVLRCSWKKSNLKARCSKKRSRNKNKPNEVILKFVSEEEDVYDVSVDTDDHLYVANNFITHNTINFGIVYGMGSSALSQTASISKREAKKFIDKFFSQYKGIKIYQEKLKRQLFRGEPLRTLTGRYRRIPFKGRLSGYEAERAFRQYFNSIIQGCQEESTLICTDSGYVPIKELCPKKHSLVQANGDKTNNYTVHNVGNKQGYLLKTSYGSGVYSSDHRFMCYEEGKLVWKKLEHLSEEDTVAVNFKEEFCGNDIPDFEFKHAGKSWNSNSFNFEEVSLKEAEFLGVLIGDGSYSSEGGKVSLFGQKDYLNYIINNILIPTYKVSPDIVKTNNSKGLCYKIDMHIKGIRKRLLQLGLDYVSGSNKEVPEWILSSPYDYQVSFLRGLFDTDGGINGGTYGFCSKSKDIVDGASRILLNLGIPHNKYYSDLYRLRFIRDGLIKFRDIVGSNVKHKLSYLNSKDSYYTEVPKELANDIGVFLSKRDLRKAKFTCAESSLRHKLEHFGGSSEECANLLDKMVSCKEKSYYSKLLEYDWTSISSIEKVGNAPMMDIEIFSDNHSYISQGFITHNSAADIMALAMKYLGEWFKNEDSQVKCLAQIHDELLFSIPETSHVYRAFQKIIEIMESSFNLKVPLIADGYIGYKWVKKMVCPKCGGKFINNEGEEDSKELDLYEDIDIVPEPETGIRQVVSECCGAVICRE